MRHLVLVLIVILLNAEASPAQTQLRNMTSSRMPLDDDVTWVIVMLDVNGDGHMDIFSGNSSNAGPGGGGGQDLLYINNGRGTFVDQTGLRMPALRDSTLDAAAGDLDGDRDMDLIKVANGSALLLLNDNGVYSQFEVPLPFNICRSVALADLDCDGDLDIVLGTDGQNHLLLQTGLSATGTPEFADATSSLPQEVGQTWAVALGDADGDGDLDIVCGNVGQNRLYQNVGLAQFVDVTASHLPLASLVDGTYDVEWGDIDSDGDLDLALANEGQDTLLQNSGLGFFTDITDTALPVAEGIETIEFADIDEDGDTDLICGSWQMHNQVLLNDGSGVFLDSPDRIDIDGASWQPTHTETLAVGDVDGDGDLDVVFGNVPHPVQSEPSPQNLLYVNHHRQLGSAAPPQTGSTYGIDIDARPGYGPPLQVALPLIGFAEAAIPMGALGTLRVDVGRLFTLPITQLVQPSGRGTAWITVPDDIQLVGVEFFVQALVIELAGEARFTNVVAEQVLR